MERERPAIQSSERPAHTTLPLTSNPACHSLHICDPVLFHATFFKWTLHTLKTAPLTTPSLDYLDLSLYDWALTLPRLTLPALASLTIGPYCAIPVPDLTAFLARHPLIDTLDLSFHITIGALRPPIATTILPRLASLMGTPDYILYLLAGQNRKDAHPELRHVRVTSNEDSEDERAQFAQLMTCVEGLRAVPRVELSGKMVYWAQVPAHLQAAR